MNCVRRFLTFIRHQSLRTQAISTEMLLLLKQTQCPSHGRSKSLEKDEDEDTTGTCNALSSEVLRRGINPPAKYRRVSLWTPSWLSSIAWDFEMVVTSSNLRQFNLRQYHHRYSQCEVFSLIRDGDLAGLRTMFLRRDASPFDRDEKGLSLLHVSCVYQSFCIKDYNIE